MANPGSGRSRADNHAQHDIVATFGTNLKAARLKMGLTQAELAVAAGLLQQYVSLVEPRRQNVTLTTAEALAKVVNKDVRMLLARPSPRPTKEQATGRPSGAGSPGYTSHSFPRMVPGKAHGAPMDVPASSPGLDDNVAGGSVDRNRTQADTSILAAFGRKLTAARVSAGLTQQESAAASASRRPHSRRSKADPVILAYGFLAPSQMRWDATRTISLSIACL
jgi:transcriptional regulator with XRE-family HTH domain